MRCSIVALIGHKTKYSHNFGSWSLETKRWPKCRFKRFTIYNIKSAISFKVCPHSSVCTAFAIYAECSPTLAWIRGKWKYKDFPTRSLYIWKLLATKHFDAITKNVDLMFQSIYTSYWSLSTHNKRIKSTRTFPTAIIVVLLFSSHILRHMRSLYSYVHCAVRSMLHLL